MAIDFSLPRKPNETNRFNTEEIMLHFINLLNPEKFKDLDQPTRAKLATIANDLAAINKELQNPLAKTIEILKTHLGTPVKGSKGQDALMHLNAFETNNMPNLYIQQDELKKALETFRTQFDLLVAKGSNLAPAQVDNLKAELEKCKTSKAQNFVSQKTDLTEKLATIQTEAAQATGKPLSQVLHEPEAPAAAVAQPTQLKS